MLLTPEYIFKDITAITPEFLRAKGITALVLDVDNTLTGHDSQQLPPSVAAWLATMQAQGIALMIASNNTAQRVAPFAAEIGLDYVASSAKPLPRGLKRAQQKFGVPKSQLAIVGDQLFTDRLAGSLFGITALVVVPRSPDFHKGILLKRKLEQPFLRRYYKKGGRLL